MPKRLTPAQVAAYERDGFVFPVDVLTPDEVRACRGELEAWERARGAAIDFPEKSKSYLLFAWADRLVHHSRCPVLVVPRSSEAEDGAHDLDDELTMSEAAR